MTPQNAIYAVVAYGLAWAGLLGYLLAIAGRQRRLEADLRALEEARG